MTLVTRMRTWALALICTAAIAGQAAAAGPQALSPWDAQRYAAAFQAVDHGDFIEAEMQAAEVKDPALKGHLALRQLLHPTVHKATFEELAAWLSRYADLPGADRVFALASRRKPEATASLTAPLLAGGDWAQVERTALRVSGPAAPDRGRAAREAFYSGDAQRALTLAAASGERWIAGMAAYRLKDYAQAASFFDQLVRDDGADAWLRSAAGYWASRAATQTGDTARATAYLRMAARNSGTFYGMIAERQVRLLTAARPMALSQAAPAGDFVLTAYAGPTVELSKFVRADPRAHRAAALAQIGLPTEAGLELRAGLALAKAPAERSLWTSLVLALNAPLSTAADAADVASGVSSLVPLPDYADYPTPELSPRMGFTLDKALVYAIVRQESRFNPQAVSRSGAVGLMQLMPEAAARAAGDDKLKSDMSPLFDPAMNLRVGQDYVTWLMERGVGYDLLRTVAAYNGGPGTLQKTAQMLGDDADSLLVIECLPSLETRNYVEKVVAAYWTYRKKFGSDSKTLDALASGAKFVDARLDR